MAMHENGMMIYVFDTASRDELLRAGFLMLKEDERNGIWVFAADDTLQFNLDSATFRYVDSNTLTF